MTCIRLNICMCNIVSKHLHVDLFIIKLGIIRIIKWGGVLIGLYLIVAALVLPMMLCKKHWQREIKVLGEHIQDNTTFVHIFSLMGFLSMKV